MRTLPFNAATARGIHALITIYMFTTTLRFTTNNRDVTIDGHTWKASASVNLTQIMFVSDGSPAGADLRLSPDGIDVIAGWGARGLFDGRSVTIELFDTANPTDGTFDMIPGAIIGSAKEDSNGIIILAVQGRLSLLRGPATELHTTICRVARFGDDRCKIPLDVPVVARATDYITQADSGSWFFTQQVWARVFQSGSYNDVAYECTTLGTTHPTVQPVYSTTHGDTITDGTAVFTCRVANIVAATGAASDFFNIQLTANPTPLPTTLGIIIPQDGPLTGLRIQIAAYDSGTSVVTLCEPYAPSNFPSPTSFLIHPGCDRLATTCRDTWHNLNNFRGTPYAPAADILTGRA